MPSDTSTRIRTRAWTTGLALSAALGLLGVTGCPKKEGGGTKEGTAKSEGEGAGTTPDTQAKPPAQAEPPVGMTDPFPRYTSVSSKAYGNGYKALKTKNYDEALAAFNETVAAMPDHLQARYQAARTLLLAGKLAEAREQLEQLLMRNFVAYAGRAASGREWKPLRDSPEWARYQQAEASAKTAYARNLSQGFIFIARSSNAKPVDFVAGKDPKNPAVKEAALDLSQEVYHYDPASARYRPLTYTEGKVFAAMRSADGKTLSFVTATRVQRDDKSAWFVEPKFGYVDLATLDTVGPVALAGSCTQLALGFGGGGEALVAATTPGAAAPVTYEFDTAHTGLAKSPAEHELKGDRTFAEVEHVWHGDKSAPAGIAVAADRRTFKIADNGATVLSARDLQEASIEWSPGKKFIAYAGALNACEALKDENAKGAKNELFVYDVTAKSAQRIDSGVSSFETLWLDDNLLVYENGIGARGTINTYDLAAHKKTTLSPRFGAGLYGVPSLRCVDTAPAAAAEPAEPPEATPLPAPPPAPAHP